MTMTILALVGWVLFLLLAFILRSVMQYLSTGKTGFVGVLGRPFSAAWWGGFLFVIATIGCPIGCALDLLGLLSRCPGLLTPCWQCVAFGLYGIGLLGTLWAQVTMGASWRIGVDPSAKTQLVTHGPFAYVRNPIFTCMMVLALGLAILVPNWVSWLSVLALLTGLELQVRIVEEPYLLRTHSDSYRRYAQATGRFVPGLGRLPSFADSQRLGSA